MDIQLFYFILMLAIFIVGAIVFKFPTGLSMMAAAVIVIVLYSIIRPEHLTQIPRHLVEGAFGYVDAILTIAAAMIFMKFIEAIGTLDLLSVFVVEKLHRFPSLLLISFMLIIMFPAMITGSSVTSVVTAGVLVYPMMLAIGIPKKETVGIIALGGVLGMVAPPINLPVMIICDAIDMPYIGFTVPLFILAFPPAIFSVLYLGKKYVKKIDLESMKDKMHIEIKNEVNALVYIPLLVLVVLMIMVNFFPGILPTLGLPLVFLISALPALFIGKKFKILKEAKDGIKRATPVLAMLFGIGMLIQVMTLTGIRGYIVYHVMAMGQVTVNNHPIFLYLASMTIIPAFGGISPFGSVTVFGGPLVMSVLFLNNIIVASAVTLFAGVGDCLPPSAIAGRTAAQMVGVEKYSTVLPKIVIPIVVIILYTMLFLITMGMYY